MRHYSSQRGAALIVVMIMLLVIMIIGTLAVRQSLISLGIATNGQAQQLLIQNSDSAFFNVEREDNLIQSLTASGMFGYINGAANKDKEMVFCFRGEESAFFDINRASLMMWEAGKTQPTNDALGKDGYCSVSASSGNFFTSGRRAVMTQVSVKFSSQSENDPFYAMQYGTDSNGVKFEKNKPVKVFAVSIMPTFSSESSADIDECLNSHMSEVTMPSGITPATGAKDSVTECLARRNIPFTTQVTEYLIAQDFV
ncbi:MULTISPECIES: PilX N-terminal domain-containing pilus assembly protein [Acinetobacter]|uniref:Pilus assembly protein PilX n=1 Tax=Acinetobacter guerrae TaxID=1843371 RepID=A0A3A8EB18_9GAMM|nr:MULTISPECIES: PilX N-terminal domain-containing pilus assembly protein [Acinetobacter]MBK0064783.1 pilus assembly protein PilX [Acinetobacter sp. S55]MBK0068146.1 pilus assembly protein PilX [Acinetobacter sp. S54]RKG31369.1 pilus assembly protein PilX [Acinetobacter guerrae]